MKVILFLLFNIVIFTAYNASNEFGTSNAATRCTCADASKTDQIFTELIFGDVSYSELLCPNRTETSYSSKHTYILSESRKVFSKGLQKRVNWCLDEMECHPNSVSSLIILAESVDNEHRLSFKEHDTEAREICGDEEKVYELYLKYQKVSAEMYKIFFNESQKLIIEMRATCPNKKVPIDNQ